jgi:drug/metabolite transporter (DMT)-like permease
VTAGSPLVRGAGLIVFSATCVAVDTILAKIVTQEVSPIVLVFFRNLFGVVVMLPWVIRTGPRALSTRRPWLHVLRATIKIVALVGFFYGVSRIPVAQATAIAFATPLFVGVGAALFLGESLRRGRLVGILIGFVGVLVIIRPGFAAIDPAAIAVLASTVGIAIIGLMMKVMAKHDTPDTITLLNLALSVPLALVPALLFWTTPSPAILGLMAVQGLLGAASQLAVSSALRHADASLMLPIDFVRLPIVAALGYVFLSQVADAWVWAGAAVILVGIILLLRSGRSPGPPR